MYSVEHSEQMLIFLACLGLGFLFGVLYDVLRALRLSFTKSKAAVIIFDFIYLFLFGFFTYIFIIAANKGEFRSYIIAGEIIGGVFYYFSFGIVAVKLTDKFVALFRKIYSTVFKWLFTPFRLFKKLFSALFAKITEFFKKSNKKSEKMMKKHLPKVRVYVYNLLGILCAGKFKSQKGGSSFGNEE